jgi:hypothetical protein
VGFSAAAAEDVACTPSTPAANFAIDGALMGVAHLALIESRAADTAVASGRSDSAMAVLDTTIAYLAAHTPARPGGDSAILRAQVHVAFLGLGQTGASHAASDGRDRDLAGARLGASAATAGANTVLSPQRDLAVNGADLRVADLGTRECWAHSARARSALHDMSMLVIHTTTADHGAHTPVTVF